MPRIVDYQLLAGQRVILISDMSQFPNGNHKIVAVNFDEIVSSYGCRIDVMFSERTDKILK